MRGSMSSSTEGWDALATVLKGREDRVRAFYLALEPRFFGPICERLKASGVLTPNARLVVEKPLGDQLASYRALNAQLTHASTSTISTGSTTISVRRPCRT